MPGLLFVLVFPGVGSGSPVHTLCPSCVTVPPASPHQHPSISTPVFQSLISSSKLQLDVFVSAPDVIPLRVIMLLPQPVSEPCHTILTRPTTSHTKHSQEYMPRCHLIGLSIPCQLEHSTCSTPIRNNNQMGRMYGSTHWPALKHRGH